jgi:hypothetical protein
MADTKYPCVSDASRHFNFGTNSNGIPTPVPGDTGAENFKHLCPTKDVNESSWSGDGPWTFVRTEGEMEWRQPRHL